MKAYPQKTVEKKTKETALTVTEKITRIVALVIAFISVYFFFFKILFF
jgi:hypothetical protein